MIERTKELVEGLLVVEDPDKWTVKWSNTGQTWYAIPDEDEPGDVLVWDDRTIDDYDCWVLWWQTSIQLDREEYFR